MPNRRLLRIRAARAALVIATVVPCTVTPGAAQREAVPREGIPAALAWLVGQQRADGGWNRPPRVDGVAPSGSLGRVGTTSLCLLALIEGGSTLRKGLHAHAARRAAAWLRAQHREGLQHAAVPAVEHALATASLARAAAASDYTVLESAARRMLESAARRVLESAAGMPPGPEAVCWYLQAAADIPAERRPAVDPFLVAAESLVVEELPADAAVRLRVRALAGALGSRAAGGARPEALSLRAPPPRATPVRLRAWLHTAWGLRDDAGEGAVRVRRILVEALRRAQVRDVREVQRRGAVVLEPGPHHGSFDPVGPEAEDLGRVAATAMLALTWIAAER